MLLRLDKDTLETIDMFKIPEVKNTENCSELSKGEAVVEALLQEYYLSVQLKKRLEEKELEWLNRKDTLRLYIYDMENLSRELNEISAMFKKVRLARTNVKYGEIKEMHYKIIATVVDGLLMTHNCRTESLFSELENIIKSNTGTLAQEDKVYINGDSLLPKEMHHKYISYKDLAKVLWQESKKLYR